MPGGHPDSSSTPVASATQADLGHAEAIAAIPARGPVEQTHVVEAFTFEPGKAHEQRSRKATASAGNADTDLCEQVAAALNLPVPKGKPAEDVTVSPVLVQILAEPGRVDRRKIGIIANAGSDLAGISKLVKAAAALGVTALVIARWAAF